TSSASVNKKAARLLWEIAETSGISPRGFLEALLHYAGSIYNRPGPRETNKPFELLSYVGPDSGFADRWFRDQTRAPLSLTPRPASTARAASLSSYAWGGSGRFTPNRRGPPAPPQTLRHPLPPATQPTVLILFETFGAHL